jgi:hypothetical protein
MRPSGPNRAQAHRTGGVARKQLRASALYYMTNSNNTITEVLQRSFILMITNRGNFGAEMY